MSIQSIGLQAIFDDHDFQKGVDRYQKEVGNAGKATDSASGKMSALGNVAKGAVVVGLGAATLAAGGFIAAAKFGVDALVDWNDQVNTLSDNLGTTGEQSATWAAAFNHVGLSVDEGSTGLNIFTKNLAAYRDAVEEGKGDTNDFGKSLTRLGVDAFDSSGKLRTFDEVMPDIMDAFQQLPAGVDKTALAMELFGTKGGTKFIDFLSQGSEGLEKARQMVKDFGLDLTTEGSGAIEEFGFMWNDLQLAITGVMAQIGIAVLPLLQDLIGFLTAHVLPVFSKWAQFLFPLLAQGIQTVVELLAPFVVGLADLAQQFFHVLSGGELFEDFGADFAALFGDNEQLVWDFVYGVAKGIKFLVDTFFLLENVIHQFVGAVINGDAVAWLDWTEDAFGPEVGGMIIGLADLLHNVLGAAFTFVVNGIPVVVAALQTIGTVIGAVWQFIQPILSTIFKELGKFWLEIQPKLLKAWDAIWKGIQAAWNFISSVVMGVAGAIAAFLEKHGDELITMFEGIWQYISGIFEVAWALISGVVKIALDLIAGDFDAAGKDWQSTMDAVWAGMKNIFAGAWKAIGALVGIAMTELVTAINKKMEEARQGIVDKLNQAIDWLRSLPEKAKQIGYDIIQGLIDGFWQQAGAIQAAITAILQPVLDAINNVLSVVPGMGGGTAFAAQGFAAGGGGRNVLAAPTFHPAVSTSADNRAVTVNFNGAGGPTSLAQAETQASWLVGAMRARGLN